MLLAPRPASVAGIGATFDPLLAGAGALAGGGLRLGKFGM
jgi:hypothetical protein